jgi:hypothetical protein
VSVPRTEDLKYATYLLGMRFPGSLKYEIVEWQYQSNWRMSQKLKKIEIIPMNSVSEAGEFGKLRPGSRIRGHEFGYFVVLGVGAIM